MREKRKYIMLKDNYASSVGYAKIQNDKGNNKILLVLENMKSNGSISVWVGDSKSLKKENIGRVILDKEGRGELKAEIVLADIDTVLGMVKDKTLLEGYDAKNCKKDWDRVITPQKCECPYIEQEQIDPIICKPEISKNPYVEQERIETEKETPQKCECPYIEQEQIDPIICKPEISKNPYVEQEHLEAEKEIPQKCECPYIEQEQIDPIICRTEITQGPCIEQEKATEILVEEDIKYLEGEYEEIIKALRMLERSRDIKFHDCDWFRVQDKLPYLQRAELLSSPFLCTERLADNAYQCKIGIEYDKQGEKIKNIYFAVPEGLWNEEDVELKDKGFNIKTGDYLIKAVEVK